MEIPLQINFKGLDHSEAVETRVREHVARLEKFHGRITSCRVVIEAPERRHTKGNLFRVRIDAVFPGGEIIVNNHSGAKREHADVHVAIRDVFNAARRRIKERRQRAAGRTKRHEAPPRGRVIRIFPEDGYGFVALSDGQEIYFHGNSVVGGEFDKLEVGSEVRVAVAEGESAHGPQASTIHRIGKHHLVE